MNIRMLGYNISNQMREKDISYRQLGERINAHHATVKNHIEDPRRITLLELFKIGAALGIDWMDLLEGVE